MRHLETSITIQAPAEKVWATLLDFQSYAEWNPFIRSIQGEATVGTYLENTLHLDGQKPQVFRPEVLRVEEEKEFRWRGKLFVKGLFDGEHYFLLKSVDEQTTQLIHGEHFSGLLSAVIMRMIGDQTQKGFHAMNEALKQRCE